MKNHFKRHAILYSIILFILIIIAITATYIVCDNNRIVNTKFTYKSRKVPEAFDGYKMVVVSDFHNAKNYQKVIDSVKAAQPDVVFITGDLISMNSTDLSYSRKLVDGLVKITDTYYVYGNHEYYYATENNTEVNKVMKDLLKDSGVIFMNNRGISIEKDEEIINLTGFADSYYEDCSGCFAQTAEPFLKAMDSKMDKGILSVLLIHRPQYLDTYSKYNYDLILSGHLHGGMINIEPFKSMLLKTKYGTDEFCKGKYTLRNSTLIISGGLAVSAKFGSFRVNNTPEIVTVTLERKRFSSR